MAFFALDLMTRKQLTEVKCQGLGTRQDLTGVVSNLSTLMTVVPSLLFAW